MRCTRRHTLRDFVDASRVDWFLSLSLPSGFHQSQRSSLASRWARVLRGHLRVPRYLHGNPTGYEHGSSWVQWPHDGGPGSSRLMLPTPFISERGRDLLGSTPVAFSSPPGAWKVIVDSTVRPPMVRRRPTPDCLVSSRIPRSQTPRTSKSLMVSRRPRGQVNVARASTHASAEMSCGLMHRALPLRVLNENGVFDRLVSRVCAVGGSCTQIPGGRTPHDGWRLGHPPGLRRMMVGIRWGSRRAVLTLRPRRGFGHRSVRRPLLCVVQDDLCSMVRDCVLGENKSEVAPRSLMRVLRTCTQGSARTDTLRSFSCSCSPSV